MSYFLRVALGAGMMTGALFNYHTESRGCTPLPTHTHSSSVKQCALIKRSHYTQEEIPAGAVYQSLVHFLLLLRPHICFFLLPIFFFFFFLQTHPSRSVIVCVKWGMGLCDPFSFKKQRVHPKVSGMDGATPKEVLQHFISLSGHTTNEYQNKTPSDPSHHAFVRLFFSSLYCCHFI